MSSVDSTAKTSRLEGINRVLMGLGESPVAAEVTSGDQRMLDVSSMLDAVTKEVLLRGWTFNSAVDVVITAVAGVLTLPAAVLEADPTDQNNNFVQRGNVLWDLSNNTNDQFSGDYKFNVIYGLTFAECPERCQEYIIRRAIRKLIQQYEGEDQYVQLKLADEQDALDELERAEYRTEDDEASVLQHSSLYPYLYCHRLRLGY